MIPLVQVMNFAIDTFILRLLEETIARECRFR